MKTTAFARTRTISGQWGSSPLRAGAPAPAGGYALVIVLFSLVICALLVVLLLDRSKLGLQSASTYSQAAHVRSLADMAVNRVQAQIKDATTVNQKTDTPLSQRDSWASQPGAIRVYAANGNLRDIYKLYSSDTMLTDQPNLSADVPTDWYLDPSEFTDLNEPVRDEAGAAHYPILNPDAAKPSPPLAAPLGLSEGFSIASTAPLSQDPTANPAPMPVRWIYVLQDGTLCQLGDSRIDRTTNPIVGRIAFWTDDETAKVNINTASPVSENAYWDQPRAWSTQEHGLAWAQPAQNEYQRYPGHPSMVSLRAILGNLNGISGADYFKFSPSCRWGGSEEGAKTLKDERVSLLSQKKDRAYVTTDEMLFQSNPVGRQNPLDPQQLESLRFFLTASSRAPELNLFGQPRVTIWPIHEVPDPAHPDPNLRTPYDNLIAFVSTVGGKPYYFTRSQPLDPAHDYSGILRNQELYSYLQNLTAVPVPGFPGGKSFADKYSDDRDQILTEIFDYIRITNLNEVYAGRPTTFQSYTTNWRFDNGNQSWVNTELYAQDGPVRGAGLVVPIVINNGTRGMGRFPVIAEVGLWFIKHFKVDTNATKLPKTSDVPLPPTQLEAMLLMETISPAFGYMPWCGKDLTFAVTSCSVGFSIPSGGQVSNMFPVGVTSPIYYPPLLLGGSTPGGYDGSLYVLGKDFTYIQGPGAAAWPRYPFMSDPLDLNVSDSTFSITEGDLTIDVAVGGTVVQSYTIHFPGATGLPLPDVSESDTIYLSGLPSWKSAGTKFRPWWGGLRTGSSLDGGVLDTDVIRSVELANGDARLVAGYRDVPNSFFTARAEYTDPSKRLVHGLRNAYFNGHVALWKDGTAGTYVNNLGPGFSKPILNTTTFRTGRYETNLPKIPPSITSLRGEGWSGDFDNAWGRYTDGPFINKSDEGAMHTSGSLNLSNVPYNSSQWSVAEGLFSPLRQVPSAVMFGSLPTGVKANIPWRTLLFCPNPADPDHIGFSSPGDHLLLDLFRMPVVEPYAISGPLSTDGKINMNYAIAPFSYIRRASSWYALLLPMKMFVVSDSQWGQYKDGTNTSNVSNVYRKKVNIAKTLEQFDSRFATNDIFRSATEICKLFLVPEDGTLASVKDLAAGYWSTRRLTGDNSREKPYAELYPKLTTQSNTYRVHMRVQALPKSGGSLPSGTKDFQPLAEYRGDRLIERYLDPGNPRFSGVDPDQDNLNELYQFRTLESRQFVP